MEDHNNEKRPRQQGRSNYTRRRQRRKNHSPSTASRSAAVPRSPSRLQRAMR